jgi:small neutral amino acid transporter SnatA (MarC family)
VIGTGLTFFFLGYTIYLYSKSCALATCDKSYQFPMLIGIINVLLWAFLMYFSCTFITQLKRRFGKQYGRAIFKLTTILVIFSIAFLFRGTFNIVLHFFPPENSSLGMN